MRDERADVPAATARRGIRQADRHGDWRSAVRGLAGRLGGVMAAAFSLVVLPATAASAAPPWAPITNQRINVAHLLVGAAVVLVVLLILWGILRVVRRRAGS
jgi:hypothetical protein